MDATILGVAGIFAMLLLMFLGLPIAFTLALVGLGGTVVLLGWSSALPQLHITLYSIVSSYSLTVLPFFILMGFFADVSGISNEIFGVAEKWLRRLPGGLALATIAGCAGFASISGSSVATAATMGAVALPEMKKYGYSDSLAAGTVAAGGTLGFLIPPSVAFVMYGIIAEESVGKLLIAGYIPGILLAIAFMSIVIIQVKINPNLAPSNPDPISWKQKIIALKDIWGMLIVFVMVMGGILFGIFTATEAGGMGAFVLFVFVILKRRMTRKILFNTLLRSATVTCMIFTILFGAYLFGDFLTLSQVPTQMINAMTAISDNKYVIFAMVVVIYLILGCFIESVPMLVLTVPIILPLIKAIGFDPIWFGVIVVMMVEAALITPPVGMNVFVISGLLKNVPMTTIFKGAMPFVLAILALVILLVIFPQIATFLPRVAMK